MDRDLHERLRVIDGTVGKVAEAVVEIGAVLDQLLRIATEPGGDGELLKALNRIEDALVTQTALLEGWVGGARGSAPTGTR